MHANNVPTPLFAYQDEGADIMASRARFGLHDEMGVGKTPTTIGAINRIGGKRGMVICPALLRENWLKEIRRFSKYPIKVAKGKTIHDYIAWERGRFDLLITSYEQATKWTERIKEQGIFMDFIALDEAHYLKNLEANRTRTILGHHASGSDSLVQWAEYAWHITGTPMANGPMDTYTFLRFCDAHSLEPKAFADRYFNQRLGTYSTKYTVKDAMVPELQAFMDANSIHRTHQDVGMYLPPVVVQELLIEGLTNELSEYIAHYPHLEELIVEAIETNDTSLLEAAHVATVRRLLGKAKAVTYSKLLKAELEAGYGKRVVFCAHTEPLLYVKHFLEKHGYAVGVIYGDTTEASDNETINGFQNGNYNVVVCNLQKAGQGITLHASCMLDMLESDWTPARNAQAIKRVHRYGQERSVYVRFVTLAESFDVVINNLVASKTADIAKIHGHSMVAAPGALDLSA